MNLPIPFSDPEEAEAQVREDRESETGERLASVQPLAGTPIVLTDKEALAIAKYQNAIFDLTRVLAAMTKERDELADKLTAQVLFSAMAGRLITKVFEAADMSLPAASDAELSLVRIISDRDTLRARLPAAEQDADALAGALEPFAGLDVRHMISLKKEPSHPVFGLNATQFNLGEVIGAKAALAAHSARKERAP